VLTYHLPSFVELELRKVKTPRTMGGVMAAAGACHHQRASGYFPLKFDPPAVLTLCQQAEAQFLSGGASSISMVNTAPHLTGLSVACSEAYPVLHFKETLARVRDDV
jgi:hypothetical protein